MKKEIMGVLLLIISLLLIVGLLGSVNAESGNATMTVEVNIMGFANQSGNVSDVSIEVPDYINLGNVTKDNPVSEEVDVYINNTGKLPITVTPQLKDSDELIFSYLYFRTRTSSGNESL